MYHVETDEENLDAFLDEGVDISDQVVTDLMQSSDEILSETEAKMEEAVLRIEEANLLKLLVSSSIFDPGSARPEIIESVDRKLKAFAIAELQSLLGMGSERASAIPDEEFDQIRESVSIITQFSPKELQALKILASKVIGHPATPSDEPPPEPKLNRISQQEPKASPKNKKASPSAALKTVKASKSTSNVGRRPKTENKTHTSPTIHKQSPGSEVKTQAKTKNKPKGDADTVARRKKTPDLNARRRIAASNANRGAAVASNYDPATGRITGGVGGGQAGAHTTMTNTNILSGLIRESQG